MGGKGGRGPALLVQTDSCALLAVSKSGGWETLPVPVRRAAIRHRPTPNRDQLFLLAATRRSRSLPGAPGSE